MVFFKCFKSNTINILAMEGNSLDRGTTLKLCTSLTGSKELVLLAKDNSMYIKSWFSEVSWEGTDMADYLLQEVAQRFVECFHETVGWSMIHRRLVLLELVFLAKLVHESIGELFSVIGDDVVRHTISMDDMLFDETGNSFLLDFL
ncbi:hypothetical protein D8674_000440 [Pyrus ussuriensis x Pyrus communis]|uniref:Uncharacterized protein n=1 Tax=Pyrus ussuriensis x Pyrus communis TaxID=2448454 RepID=A0A5N5F8V4_9ROSA|nr:hypothetical protein D8674_000440 [Pyrus ussuriensis x Pyrus communis]